jgi:hypothetical protein
MYEILSQPYQGIFLDYVSVRGMHTCLGVTVSISSARRIVLEDDDAEIECGDEHGTELARQVET